MTGPITADPGDMEEPMRDDWTQAFYADLNGWPGDEEAIDAFLAFLACDGIDSGRTFDYGHD